MFVAQNFTSNLTNPLHIDSDKTISTMNNAKENCPEAKREISNWKKQNKCPPILITIATVNNVHAKCFYVLYSFVYVVRSGD